MKQYVDFHCDTLLCTAEHKKDMYALPQSMLDIQRLKNAGALAQFFAIFMPPVEDELMTEFDSDESYFQALYHTFQNTLKLHADAIAFAGNYEDMIANQRNGLVSAFLTFEDGRMIHGEMENLKKYYEKGIRLITLTWNYENCFGYPNSESQEQMQKGLKPFGIEAIREMNRLGMLIDVSHLSDGGFYDVAKYSKKPFIASHSNCRSLSPHQRNLTDDMIRVLAEHGGAAGLNFCGHFLNQDITNGYSGIEEMVKHVLHMVEIGGEDLPVIGTDFDGITGELEVKEPGEMEYLFDALKKAGLTERQLDKFVSLNALRIIKEVL